MSITFTWDIEVADELAHQWKQVAPVVFGGPAVSPANGDFVPGMYLKPGYVITSRGCPNRCWFCSVWKRDGDLRELPITEGWDVLDDNLLACSEQHIRAVFAMLQRQPHRARFTGGIEAARLNPWHVELFASLKPSPLLFMAYDTAEDLEPLRKAARLFREVRFTRHQLRCYVLIGYPGDTFYDATKRLGTVFNLGLLPMAMLYRNKKYEREPEWTRFQREWVRPKLIAAKMKEDS